MVRSEASRSGPKAPEDLEGQPSTNKHVQVFLRAIGDSHACGISFKDHGQEAFEYINKVYGK